MISDCNQNESILELASKLAIYAAENARKRQRETKDEIGKTFENFFHFTFLKKMFRKSKIRVGK